MARGAPVTIDDVEATLREIEGAGIKPTVRLVHQKLGRGSMSTISAHLRTVAAARAGTEVGDLPDPVLESLRTAADALWTDLAAAADDRIENVTRAAETRVRKAHDERDTARAALADAGDERGTLVAALAERTTHLAELESAHEAVTGQLAAAEQRAALEDRDRAALVARLDDRGAELRRALTERERAVAAATTERENLAAALESEATRRRADAAAHAEGLERLHAQVHAARADTAAAEARHASVEARLDAEHDHARHLGARLQVLQDERDAARDRAVGLGAEVDQAHRSAAEARRSANTSREFSLALHAHATRAVEQLHEAGVAASDIEPLPPVTVPGETSPAESPPATDTHPPIDDRPPTISILDLADLTASTDDDASEPSGPGHESAIESLGLDEASLTRLSSGWGLPDRQQMREIARVGSLMDQLPPDLTTTVSAMAHRGDLGLPAAMAALPDGVSSLGATRFPTDPIAEILRNAERFVLPEHAFLTDIRLTEELLASTDLARIVDSVGTPPMRSLLTDLDRVADIARRAFDTYSITADQVSLGIDSLEPSQLDQLVRQAMVQLHEEADRRGWTTSTSPAPSSTTRAEESAPELPPELQDVLDKAPPEQVGAFRRLLNGLGTQRAGTLSNLAVVVVTLVTIAMTLADDGAAQTVHTTDGDVEIHTGDAHSTLNVVNINTVDVTNEVLDAIGDDPDARTELLQRLRDIDERDRDGSAQSMTGQDSTDCDSPDDDAPPTRPRRPKVDGR